MKPYCTCTCINILTGPIDSCYIEYPLLNETLLHVHCIHVCTCTCIILLYQQVLLTPVLLNTPLLMKPYCTCTCIIILTGPIDSCAIEYPILNETLLHVHCICTCTCIILLYQQVLLTPVLLNTPLLMKPYYTCTCIIILTGPIDSCAIEYTPSNETLLYMYMYYYLNRSY